MTMSTASQFRLRRKAVLAGATCFLSFSASFLAASAADLFAGRWTVATSNVTTQATFDPTAILRIGEDNAFSKTGAGKWQVPAASASQAWPLELSVKEGEVEFTDAAATAPATGAGVTPPAVLQSAAIWFEANEGSLVTTTEHGSGDGVTYVHQWRDMRETAAADEAPTCFYAQSYYSHTNEAPTFTTYEGFPALYFGGVTSGKCMEIFTNGTVETTRSFTSIFVVHGVERTHGWLLGMTAGQGNAGGSFNIHWGSYANTALNWNVLGEYTVINTDGQSAGPVSRSVSMWWNGRKYDFRTQKIRTGQQLYEFAWNGPGACFNALFCERHIWSASTGYRQGGDYITALVAFKRQIPEDDRVRVRDYLTRLSTFAYKKAEFPGKRVVGLHYTFVS